MSMGEVQSTSEVQRIIEAYNLGRLEGRASLKEEQSAGGTLRPIQPSENFRVAVVTSIKNVQGMLDEALVVLNRSRGSRAAEARDHIGPAMIELERLKRGIAV